MYKDEQIEQDFEKCKKVILSCKNKDQLQIAYNYYQLWSKKYSYAINISEHPIFIYWNGILTGNIQGKLSQYE